VAAVVNTALQNLLGERFTTVDAVRQQHARDASHHLPHSPQAVAFPHSNDEVCQIVRLCADQRVPVVPFGTGTAVEGGIVATHGGICVDLSQMNAILRVDNADMDATVQAGVTRKQLNKHLDDLDSQLHFPVDPGADASLGGMAATRASGSAAVGYGTMRENVLGLTAVLPDGRLVRSGGRARKSAAGYDLTHLLVGSEGTLGILCEVIVKLVKKPQAVAAAVCPFSSIDAAVAAVQDVMSHGIPMARIELLDEIQMAAVNTYSQLDYEIAPTLFFEFHGSATAVDEHAQAAEHIAQCHGAHQFRWATERAARDRLWQARHDAYYASLALRPGSVGYVTDVCVPISQLASCIARAKEALKQTTIPASLFGHVGDGNFHVVFLIEPGNATELEEVRQLGQLFVEDALAVGGTCSGEHGIGLGKIDALEQELGQGIEVMRAIKRALDPHNIMNPGKVLRS